MNKLYGITNDNLIVVIESICHCPECVKRGMYEAEINLLDGTYYSTLRLDELKDFLKFISKDFMTVSNNFKKINLTKRERYEFVLKSNWRNTAPSVRHMIQNLIDENEKLEKALDKACEKLEYENNCLLMLAEEWKEWCMKDD